MTYPPDQDLGTDEEYAYDDGYYGDEPPDASIGRRLAIGALKVAAVLVIIAAAAGAMAYAAPRLAERVAGPQTDQTIPAGDQVTVVVPAGSTARNIGAILQDAGVVADGGSFERFVQVGGVADELKAGQYTFVGGMSTEAIVAILVEGPPPVDVFRVTVIEGLRIEEMLESLAEQTGYTVDELAEPLLDGTITSPYLPDELPEGADPITAWEGLLFPSTYEYRVDAPARNIVGRLANEMTRRVRAVDWTELEAADLTPYDGIVVASLIEKEAKLDEDRSVISSVIHNRLNEDMLLQVDATVIYALGENPGRVLDEHLEIDSPWNTYRYPGLPPTPIGGVRAASLEAAAHPDESDYLYYVLIDADGKHGFSETLEEHNRKVAQAREDGILP